jgi:hypothetical protein
MFQYAKSEIGSRARSPLSMLSRGAGSGWREMAGSTAAAASTDSGAN